MAFDKRKALQSALTYSQQGKWDKAIAEYQAILRTDPHDLTVCNNLGDLYARVGKAAEAIEQYHKLGELYRADGLSVKAIAVYKKIIKLDPNRTQTLLACADLYEEQGLTGEAKVQLAIVAERHAKAGNTPKVIEIYQRLAVLDPTNHTLLTKLVDLLLKGGRREEAAAQYERAAQAAEAAGLAAESKRLRAKIRELTPKSPQANLALAERLLHEGKHAEAVDALLKATASDQTNGQAWRLLGDAYLGLGQASEAITALEQAVGLGVSEDEVRRPLAKALVLEGDTDEGIALCQKLAEDALARNNPEEAIIICQEIVALAPNLARVHAYLVRLLQDLGRDDEARGATWALAAAHEACGETENAIHVYHQLLERNPLDVEAKARLELLEGPSAPLAQTEELAVPGRAGGPAAEAEPLVLEYPAPAEPTPAVLAPEALAPAELASLEFSPGESALAKPASAEMAAEEPPALESSVDDAQTLEDVTALGLGEGVEPEARPAQVFEFDETGELAAIRSPSQNPYGPAMEGHGIELPGEHAGEDVSGMEPLEEQEGASGEVAELLAEAEVYLKYGLTDKARERLLEVVRLTPENLTAHRRLKALYLDRPQSDEACEEVLAIARILQTRGQLEAAQRELQEGLGIAPGNLALQGMLGEFSGTFQPTEATPMAEPAPPWQPAKELGVEMPESPAAQGKVAQDFRMGPVPMEGAGVGETAPSGMGSTESVPAAELPDQGGGASSRDEDLPPELQSLLEESGEQPTVAVEASEASLDQTMAEDLAEAEFYLSQGMVEEARAVHQRMQRRDTSHPAVAQLANQIEPPTVVRAPEPDAPASPESEEATSFAGLLEEAVPDPQAELPPDVLDFLPETLSEIGPAQRSRVAPPQAPEATGPIRASAAQPPVAPPIPSTPTVTPAMVSPKFSVMQGGGEAAVDGFVNLGAELEQELAAEERTASTGVGVPLVEDLLREFQKGVREQLDEKDFETHYNLGIAYKEMELYDEAIQEFRLVARDPGRALACADLLGLCYLAKSDPGAAIREFRAGLDVRGHPPESYYGLRYDLSLAYETNGDLERALESFQALQSDDEGFRDVSARVQELRERLQPKVVPLPASPVQKGEPAKRAKQKKISFI